MNPIFILLVILLAILIWFLLSFMFKPIGRLFYRLWQNVIEGMSNSEDDIRCHTDSIQKILLIHTRNLREWMERILSTTV